jgi:uncharacterized membrane protein YdbT with pleckstrin-like domain
MSDKEAAEQAKKNKSPEQLKLEEAKEKTEQERCRVKQEEFRKQQEEERTKQIELEVNKRKLELETVQTKKKRGKCLRFFLSILVGAFSVGLIVEGICIFCSFKKVSNNTYNWIRLIFGSVMMVSFVVLIIALCYFIKKSLSQSDEE